MSALLQTKNITKRFGKLLANYQINFEIQTQEIHCLLGENGAGKTTFAKCIYGFSQPDEGKIIIRGEEVSLSSPKDSIEKGIGFVSQHFELIPPLTVLENIIAGSKDRRLFLEQKKTYQEIGGLCGEYGIELDLGAKVRELSVGEQQWVEILKALYQGAELLILDEPTASLTPQETEKLFAILEKMKETGLSVLLITHKLDEVMEISDRVTILRKGKKVGTHKTKGLNKKEIARMMVGREVLFAIEKKEVAPGEPLLFLEGVSALNDRGKKNLREVSLTLHEKEILGIAGVSGNGQKELFEVIIGVRKIEEGIINFKGENIQKLTPRQRRKKGIAHVPADRLEEGVAKDFPVTGNMILGFHRDPPFQKGLFLDYSVINSFTQKAIEEYEIAVSFPQQLTQFLSGGNLQKVVLARELSHKPECLISNQPTRGLDVGAIEFVHKQIIQQKTEGAGILLISEDLDEIMKISDRIVVFYKGQIVGTFATKEATFEKVGFLMMGGSENTHGTKTL